MLIRALYDFYILKRHLSLSPSDLLAHQHKKLVAVVKHAYDNVPFYHQKLESVGVTPGDIRSIKDLSKIPVTTKQELQSCARNDVLASDVEANQCIYLKTSGSSGRPLDIYLNRSASDYRFALMAREFWENGLRPWHKMAIICSTDPDLGIRSPRFRGVVRRLRISRAMPVGNQLDILKEYTPDFIASNPSSLVPVANMCLENKVNIRPQLVFTDSELLMPDEAKLIRSVFDCDSVDEYSSFEIGPMAWECREHAGYHINVDGVVLEFLDKSGNQVSPGERGDIVCTSLVNYSMPFIRYQIDDIGIPSNETCPCGRPLPLMKIVEGRADDFLTATDGRIISPLVLYQLWYLGHPQGVTQFRVIQETREKLTIQLEGLNAPLDQRTMRDARKKLGEILGEDIHVEFQLVRRLGRDPSGKLRKIISRVTRTSSS